MRAVRRAHVFEIDNYANPREVLLPRIAEVMPFLTLTSTIQLLPGVAILPAAESEENVGWHAHSHWEYRWYDRGPHSWAALRLESGGIEELASALCAIDLILGRWRYLHGRACFVERIQREEVPLKEWPRAPRYHLSSFRAARFRDVLSAIKSGGKDPARKRRIALRRWHAATHTTIGIDTVMHGIAALEGLLLSGTGDMRLRLAVRAAGAVGKAARGRVFREVYSKYKIRSDYAHGLRLPEVPPKEQLAFLDMLDLVFRGILTVPVPSSHELEQRVIPWMRSVPSGWNTDEP